MDWSCILGTSVKPYPHQQRTAEAFMAGKSVLLRAPTGSGKTEAIVGPFLHALAEGTAATPRLVYSLPLRVLATSLRDRVAQWAPDVPIMCQHGDEPQVALFHRPVVFTTVDQTIE
jgi:CRISPR-associated endonuclease/helicase Cas3